MDEYAEWLGVPLEEVRKVQDQQPLVPEQNQHLAGSHIEPPEKSFSEHLVEQEDQSSAEDPSPAALRRPSLSFSPCSLPPGWTPEDMDRGNESEASSYEDIMDQCYWSPVQTPDPSPSEDIIHDEYDLISEPEGRRRRRRRRRRRQQKKEEDDPELETADLVTSAPMPSTESLPQSANPLDPLTSGGVVRERLLTRSSPPNETTTPSPNRQDEASQPTPSEMCHAASGSASGPDLLDQGQQSDTDPPISSSPLLPIEAMYSALTLPSKDSVDAIFMLPAEQQRVYHANFHKEKLRQLGYTVEVLDRKPPKRTKKVPRFDEEKCLYLKSVEDA